MSGRDADTVVCCNFSLVFNGSSYPRATSHGCHNWRQQQQYIGNVSSIGTATVSNPRIEVANTTTDVNSSTTKELTNEITGNIEASNSTIVGASTTTDINASTTKENAGLTNATEITGNITDSKSTNGVVVNTTAMDNHKCSSPAEIHIDDILLGFLPGISTISGQTSKGSSTTRQANIFSTRKQNQDSLCGGVSTSTSSLNGAWFSFVGTGRSVQATTCLEGTLTPTSLVVFQGTCQEGGDTTTLECIVGENNTQPCEAPSNAATVSWNTETNTTYYIWVTGESMSGGSFELSVKELDLVANHACPNATTIDLSSSPGALVATGSTYNATRDFPYGMVCGVPLDYPGTWHQIEGSGSAISISACTNTTNYHAAVSVFEGSCDNLTCVAGMDFILDFCEFGSAGPVTWLAKNGTTYHVYVHGGGGVDVSVGSYGLTVTETPVVQPNHFCQQALIVPSSGAAISGTTSNATMDTMGPTFCGVPIVAPGLWYQVEGNGEAIQVSTCSESNTAVSIFTGSCGNLQCVNGQSSTCKIPTEVAVSSTRLRHRELLGTNSTSGSTSTTGGVSDALSWLADEGETYYLFVQGEPIGIGSTVGSFQLDLTPVPKSTFYCQSLWSQYQMDYSEFTETMTCDCSESEDGTISLICSSTCLYCNSLSTVCVGDESFGTTVNATGDIVSEWESYRYLEGRNETLLVEYNDNSTCAVTINDSMVCSSCEVVTCADGTPGYSVDCQNVVNGAFFVNCPDSLSTTLVEGTILEGIFGDGFDECNMVETLSPTSVTTPGRQPSMAPFADATIPTEAPVRLWTRPPSIASPTSTSSTGSSASKRGDYSDLLWHLPLGALLVVAGVFL
jgi:hypothetical protein